MTYYYKKYSNNVHYGLENGNSKLSDEEVKQIREKYIPRKHTGKMLANEYGVSESLIYMILNKQRREDI